MEAPLEAPLTLEETIAIADPAPPKRELPWIRPLLAIAFAVSLILTLVLGWHHLSKEMAFQDQLRTRAQAAAQNGSEALSEKLRAFESQLAEQAARPLPTSSREAEAAVKLLLERNPDMSAAGFVSPNATGDAEKRPTTLAVRQLDGTIRLMQGEARRATPGWLEPYYRQEGGERVAEYSVAAGGTGLYFADLGAGSIKKLVSRLEIGSPGYSFIVSAEKDRVLSYPIDEYVGEKQNLHDIAKREQEPAYSQLATLIQDAEQGGFKAISGRTDSPYYLAFQRVAQTGWQYVVRLVGDMPAEAAQTAKRERLQILVALIVTLLAGLGLALKVHERRESRLWQFCLTSGAILIAGTSIIFSLFMMTHPHVKSDADIMVTDQGELTRYLSQDPYATGKLTFQKPTLIKTGLHVLAIEFSGANNITVTGTVWQQIPDEIKDKVQAGVYFPEAVKTDIRPSYVRPAVGGNTHGWIFTLTLRQAFDFSRYPLDTQDVMLRMRPVEFDKNIILIPDLEAYGTWDQNDVPGVDVSSVINGWLFERTFFDYTKARYKSNFGIDTLIGQSGFPELRFNVLLRRDFKGPMVSVVLPMAIIAALLFMNLMFAKVDDKPLAILSPIAAFFFSVALAHGKVRDTFATGDFMFMEMFCFALYFMIVLVALTLMMRATKRGPLFVQDNDGLVPKLLYWPILSSILFVSAMGVYYW